MVYYFRLICSCTLYHWHCIQIITIAIHIPSLIMPVNYSFIMFHSTGGHHQGVINELIKEIIKACIVSYIQILWDVTLSQSMYYELSFLLIFFFFTHTHTHTHTHTYICIITFSFVRYNFRFKNFYLLKIC